jgi:hypothetical protein
MSHKISSYILFADLLIATPTLAEQSTKPLVKPSSGEKDKATQEIERLKNDLALLQKQTGKAQNIQQTELPPAATIEMISLPSGI